MISLFRLFNKIEIISVIFFNFSMLFSFDKLLFNIKTIVLIWFGKPIQILLLLLCIQLLKFLRGLGARHMIIVQLIEQLQHFLVVKQVSFVGVPLMSQSVVPIYFMLYLLYDNHQSLNSLTHSIFFIWQPLTKIRLNRLRILMNIPRPLFLILLVQCLYLYQSVFCQHVHNKVSTYILKRW